MEFPNKILKIKVIITSYLIAAAPLHSTYNSYFSRTISVCFHLDVNNKNRINQDAYAKCTTYLFEIGTYFAIRTHQNKSLPSQLSISIAHLHKFPRYIFLKANLCRLSN